MMILELYRTLEKIVQSEYPDVVETTQILFTDYGRARKLRLFLIDDTFIDVWLTPTGEYSYHWETRPNRDYIYRHDNAPHQQWNHVSTFPKHCHDGTQENVVESNIADDPKIAILDFLKIVRKEIIEMNME